MAGSKDFYKFVKLTKILFMSRAFYFTIFIIFFTGVAFAQRGKDGAKNVTTNNTIYNEYTTLTADASAGATSITVAASSLNANGRFATTLAPGDLIFIIQMQGTSIVGGEWWHEYGYITSYNNCGNYEFAQVLSVPNSSSIVLSCPLEKSYSATGSTQVIRVPRITTLTVNGSGAELTCDTWNGSTGGVVVLETQNNITIGSGATINASGKGFRGGAASADCENVWNIGQYASQVNTHGAQKGEAIIAWSAMPNGYYCKGAAANGGGGGNTHNAGGGGGSNASSNFSWNGCGFPDTTTSSTYIQAWDLEGTSGTVPAGLPFHRNASYGGGRGGYSYSYNNQDALTVGPSNILWGGDNRQNNGGQGGWPLNFFGGKIFMGGGGGGGSQNDNNGGAGGNGGGIVYIMCYGNISGAGYVTANGNNGQNADGNPSLSGHSGIDGSGGAGAGGVIILNSTSSISGISAQANGGQGGTQVKKKGALAQSNGEAEGPGGGGGGGYIAISNGSITRTANGGNNGVCSVSPSSNTGDFGLSEFPPNGATKGAPGINNASVSNFSINTSNTTACQGQPAMLIASLSGSVPPGITFGWYSSEVGGSLISSNDTLFINNPAATTTYYFGTCPGTYRVAATLTVYPFSYNAGNNVTICLGNSTQLQATGGVTYQWSPATGLSDANIANPVCNATDTTTYFVTITSADNCVGTDSLTVTVNSVDATISNDTAICSGNSVTLYAGGGGTYSWNTGSSNSSITVSPAITQTYTVQVNNNGCSATASAVVTVNPKPLVYLGNDTTFCQGPTLVLNAGNPGSMYHWQDNTGQQTYNVTSTGLYAVTVTNTFNCQQYDSINVNVLPWADASITAHSPVCINAASFNYLAAQGGGIWSGSGITSSSAGTFSPATAGAGTHQIVYTIGGMCGDTDTTYITVNPLPVVALGNDTTFCQGGSLQLNAGNPGAQYHWQDNSTQQTLNVTTGGNYAVTVTDVNTCISSDQINVNVLPWADASITAHSPVCINAAPFNFAAAQGGGVWSGNGITSSASGTFSPAAAGTGTHQVVYVISGLCGDSDTTYITVNPLPVVNLGNDTTICQGQILLLDAGNPGSSYHWQDNSGNQTYNATIQGTYAVTVTDVNSCISSDQMNLTVLPWANAEINPVNPLCNNVPAFNMTAAQSGGTWSGTGITNPSAGTFDPSAVVSGNIIVVYTISGQCGDSDTTEVLVYPTVIPVIQPHEESCAGAKDAYIEVQLYDGTPPFEFTWNGLVSPLNISDLSPGSYTLGITDSNQCYVERSVNLDASIEDCFKPHVYVPNIFSPNDDGINDVLYVRGQGINSFVIEIYDRWGEKMFRSENLSDGWNGKYKGKIVMEGVYVYYIKAEMSDGNTINKKGDITVVK